MARFTFFRDNYGRQSGLDLDSVTLYIPEGTQHGGWDVRVWVQGGPELGILVGIEPEKFKDLLLSR